MPEKAAQGEEIFRLWMGEELTSLCRSDRNEDTVASGNLPRSGVSAAVGVFPSTQVELFSSSPGGERCLDGIMDGMDGGLCCPGSVLGPPIFTGGRLL